MVPMDPSTIVASFSSKQIDAAGIWYPLIDAIKARVPDLNELVANKDFYPQTSFINAYVARNEICQENPKLVVSFLKVMKKAMDYRIANLDRSIELTTAFLKAPAEATAKVAKSRKLLSSADLNKFNSDGTVEKWLTEFNGMFKDFGQVQNPLPPSQYYEAKLFASA
jgi:NitT/TauT family transport system substrate-binding protein